MPQKFFPIHTDTACQLKWNWSTLFLNTGTTRSCCRTGESDLTPENFKDFHNTPVKLSDRTSMLAGEWPKTSCGYCRDIEQVGGVSDRMRHLTIPSLTPVELETNSTAITVTPTIVEVYFSNACNLGCVYCSSQLSSTIEAEDRKFGTLTTQNNFRDLVPYFWQWFPEGFQSVKRLHVLGGEPFYQREFDRLLDMIEQYPNPDCELNIVTNLMIDTDRLQGYIDRFKHLLVSRKLSRVDITVSVDCAGPQQEYVRWGFEWNKWRENFELLISHRWLYLVINQTISALTIKTMPEFLEQFYQWRQHRKIGHWFSGIYPDPSYMKAEIFGNLEFADTADAVLNLMPTHTQEDQTARDYMQGIFKQILTSKPNYPEIARLIDFLDEKDRRRGTHWPDLFPWLERYREHVVQ
jgi:hypothetical protein